MTHSDFALFQAIRDNTRSISLEDAQLVVMMIRDGDLIHVDEVAAWVEREQARERSEHMVASAREAGL
jgi:hypothetical protein